MAVKVVTPTELEYLDRDGQWAEFFLAIDQPPIVFQAQYNDSPRSNKVVSFQYSMPSGTLGAVQAGMTMAVGSTFGASDKGLVRIRVAPDTTHFYIGETSEIDFKPGDFLTVYEEYGLWPRHMYKSGANDYADYNLVYTDQHTNYAPIILAGPNPVVWLTGAKVDVAFDASRSWVLGGAGIAFNWSAPGAGATSGMDTNAPVISYAATGRYPVTCIATANGKSTTRHWAVQVFGADRQPVTQFVPSSITSGDDGYSFSVRLYAEAALPLVRDRAHVTLFTRDHYGNDTISLGPLAGRENLIADGWIVGETITWSPEQSTVSFEVKAAGYWLGQMTCFPAGFESTTSDAYAWTNFNNLTLDKALFSILYYRSTISQCRDWSLTGDGRLCSEIPSPGSVSLWEQINTFAAQTILAKPRLDRFGRLYVEVDAQLIPPASRDSIITSMTLTPRDWRDQIAVTRSPTNKTALVDLQGMYFDGASLTALFSLAFGDVYGRYGSTTRLDRLALSSQAQSNQLAGLVMGQANNEYPAIAVQLAANNRFIDVAPNQYVSFSMPAEATPRAAVLDNIRLIPRCVTYQIDVANGTLLPSVEFEAESFPTHAITGHGLATYPDPPPVEPPPPTSPGGLTVASDVVYVALQSGVYRTRNFSSASPTWTQVLKELSGVQSASTPDPYAPRNFSYIAGPDELYKSSNLDTYANAVRAVSASNFAAGTGLTLDVVQDVKATMAQRYMVYAVAIAHDDTPACYAYLGRSFNSGLTWSWTQIAETTNATDLHGLAASPLLGGLVFVSCGAGQLYKSEDHGVTLTLVKDFGFVRPIANIECSTLSAAYVFIGCKGGGTRAINTFNFDTSLDGFRETYYTGSWMSGDGYPTPGCMRQWGRSSDANRYEPNPYGSPTGEVVPAGGQVTFWLKYNNYGPATFQFVVTAEGAPDVDMYSISLPREVSQDWTQVTLPLVNSVGHKIRVVDIRAWMTYMWGPIDMRVDNIVFCYPSGELFPTFNINYVTTPDTATLQFSDDFGATFRDITPPAGGADTWRALCLDMVNGDHLTAIAAGDNIVVTDNATAATPTWSVRQSGITGAVAIFRSPFNSRVAYLVADGHVYFTSDDFVSLLDKTGGLSVVNPRAVIPVWR